MTDTRFTAEFHIDREGYLVGKVRLPKSDAATLEALSEIIDQFAKRLEVPHYQVLNLLRKQGENASREP